MERLRTHVGESSDRRPQNSRATQSSLDSWNGYRIPVVHKKLVRDFTKPPLPFFTGRPWAKGAWEQYCELKDSVGQWH
jgi:hypothetical protein